MSSSFSGAELQQLDALETDPSPTGIPDEMSGNTSAGARNPRSPDSPGVPEEDERIDGTETEHDEFDPASMLAKLDTPLPATQWWRRFCGIGPDRATRRRQMYEQRLRSPLGRPLVVVVAQPRGGSGKTVTAIGIAAAFGSARGEGVVVWDNTCARGTLVERLEASTQGTVRDLLDSAGWFSGHESTLADLERVLNRQKGGQFCVLGSDQRYGRSRLTKDDVVVVHAILRRFFSVIVIDSGSDETAEHHQAALQLADVLVVPVRWRRDSVGPAIWMLSSMRQLAGEGDDGDHLAELATSSTIVVATGRDSDHDPAIRGDHVVRDFFAQHRIPIITVPGDSAIDAQKIAWADMGLPAQDAYRHVGALISTAGLPAA